MIPTKCLSSDFFWIRNISSLQLETINKTLSLDYCERECENVVCVIIERDNRKNVFIFSRWADETWRSKYRFISFWINKTKVHLYGEMLLLTGNKPMASRSSRKFWHQLFSLLFEAGFSDRRFFDALRFFRLDKCLMLHWLHVTYHCLKPLLPSLRVLRWRHRREKTFLSMRILFLIPNFFWVCQ